MDMLVVQANCTHNKLIFLVKTTWDRLPLAATQHRRVEIQPGPSISLLVDSPFLYSHTRGCLSAFHQLRLPPRPPLHQNLWAHNQLIRLVSLCRSDQTGHQWQMLVWHVHLKYLKPKIFTIIMIGTFDRNAWRQFCYPWQVRIEQQRARSFSPATISRQAPENSVLWLCAYC